MSDLEQRVKELETKVKILEETLETLKNMQLSEEMEGYIQSKTKTLKLVSLMNAVSDQPTLDFCQEEKSVQNVRDAKKTIDQQIAAALRNTTDFSEQYPDDPRYFNYEVEDGMVMGDYGREEKDDDLSPYIGRGIRITSYNGFDTERVIVPAQIDGQPVISIGEKAFQNANFSEIILPSSLRAILKSAFQGCINLTHIDLPERLEYLGEKCFSKTEVETISIPNSIEVIPHSCFEECKKLECVQLGNSVRVLDYSSFYECTKLKKVSMPETIQEIESYSFGGTAIEMLIIPSNATKISGQAFCRCFEHRTKDIITCVFLGKETVISGKLKLAKQIYCLPGSNAQRNAREYSIPVKPLSEFNLDEI